MTGQDELMKIEQVAVLLGVSRDVLLDWRSRSVGPKSIRFPGTKQVRYRRGDIEDWINESVRRESTAI